MSFLLVVCMARVAGSAGVSRGRDAELFDGTVPSRCENEGRRARKYHDPSSCIPRIAAVQAPGVCDAERRREHGPQNLRSIA